MRRFAIAALCACTIGCAGQPAATPSAAAGGTSAAAGGASGAPVGDGSAKLICTDEPETGTRLRHHRICATAEEWAQRRENDRNALEQLRQQASQH